jgi:hypothetical protein
MNYQAIPYLIITYLAFLHWLADFVFQTDEMAKNKSTSWKWLAAHILTYGSVLFTGLYIVALANCTAPFEIMTMLVMAGLVGAYTLANMILHMAIDAVTSRITSKLYKDGKTHQFFVVIGIDQFLHLACLIWTFAWVTILQ